MDSPWVTSVSRWLACVLYCATALAEQHSLTQSVGIVVTTYDRPEYLAQTLSDLPRTIIPNNALLEVVLVSDAHAEDTCRQMVEAFEWPTVTLHKVFHQTNVGVAKALKSGFDRLSPQHPFYTNLDSDVRLHPEWLIRLMEGYQRCSTQYGTILLSGFNTKAHEPLEVHEGYVIKKSLGGVNLFFDQEFLQAWFLPSLALEKAWDWHLVDLCRLHQIPMLALSPSVVQHIGATGMNSVGGKLPNGDPFDTADDFLEELEQAGTPLKTAQ